MFKTQKAAVLNGEVISLIELPICGMMTDEPISIVAQQYEDFENTVKRDLGVIFSSPIDSLVFMCLPICYLLQLPIRVSWIHIILRFWMLYWINGIYVI